MNNENTQTTADRPMQSITVDNLLINFTTEFQRVWTCNSSTAKPCAFWRPTPAPDLLPGYFPLGDVAISGDGNINGGRIVAVVCEGPAASADAQRGKALSPPEDFEQVWSDTGSNPAGGTLWLPLAQEGYVALGLVCSINDEKPSLNAVRCVREDLVTAASVGALIWDDQGSRANQGFSVWSVDPPLAEAGEINFAPGTFVSSNNHDRPVTDVEVYSLRMQIPVEINPGPELPILSGFAAPEAHEPTQPTQVAKLPWFAVEDHGQPPAQRLRESPYYYLQRTDRYVLIGSSHNQGDKNSLVTWTLRRVKSRRDMRLFTRISAVQIPNAWPLPGSDVERPIKFSAKLSEEFTHTQTSISGWTTPDIGAVAANVAKNTMMALYQLQSNYDLWRENRTETAINFMYSDSKSLCWLQYPPEDATEGLATPTPVAELPQLPELPEVPEVPEVPELSEVPDITNTAP
ncbi:Vps62-related protein [Pseudomonas sp. P2758]|uniref:Vps62-related protein n=1 Tax=Pseudomonas sp. P2758 TaxID=3409916 RepID=UPI003B5C797B